MIITKKLTMDLAAPLGIATVDAVQDDRYSRNLEIDLRNCGEPWMIPTDACAMIRYAKPDGVGGLYDTLPDGSTAWSVTENCLTVALAPQVLTVPGHVFLSVTLSRGIHQLTTMTILIHVHPVVGAEFGESESYISVHNFLPAPADGTVGQFLRIAGVDEYGHISALVSADGTGTPETYVEIDGVGSQQNPAAPENPLWQQWDARLAFGMDTAAAPAPFHVGGQLLADGTIIARNCGTQDKNRWGFHVFEAYARDNFSRMTMLMDKHDIEANSKPSLEFYYYTGSDHSGASYGNTKIGSDVAFHSFCFDRDKLTAYGSIDACMPITLAKISLANDLNTSYKNIAAADAAFEPETAAAQHNKCLKFIALRKAENGAMFYDADRHQVACKIGGKWCALPFTVIEDAAFDILDASKDTDVEWDMGVIDGNGAIVEHSARMYTVDCLPTAAVSVSAKEGYEFCIVPYSEGDLPNIPNPYYNPATGEFQGAAVYGKSVDLTTISLSGFPKYRLIARRTDLAETFPSEGENIVIAFEGQEEEPEISAWGNGVIDGNGSIVDNAARLYTLDYIDSAATSVTANEGYEFCVVPYNEGGSVNAPTPYYDPSTGGMEGAVVYYTEVDLTAIHLDSYPNYRLIARRTDLANISPSEGSNIVISTEVPEVPADTGWKNGIIDGNGNIAENTGRLYTPDYISESAVSVTANEGYEFCVVPYNAEGITNAPNPYYDPASGSFSTSGALWYTSVDLTTIDLGTGWVETESIFNRFKLIARRADLADISPAEGVNIVIA